jgi:hypothetical protein
VCQEKKRSKRACKRSTGVQEKQQRLQTKSISGSIGARMAAKEAFVGIEE